MSPLGLNLWFSCSDSKVLDYHSTPRCAAWIKAFIYLPEHKQWCKPLGCANETKNTFLHLMPCLFSLSIPLPWLQQLFQFGSCCELWWLSLWIIQSRRWKRSQARFHLHNLLWLESLRYTSPGIWSCHAQNSPCLKRVGQDNWRKRLFYGLLCFWNSSWIKRKKAIEKEVSLCKVPQDRHFVLQIIILLSIFQTLFSAK